MPQVIIIGGGFAGPVLALCLKRHKISSAVYETRPADYQHGGNIALAPNALRVLNHIGIYDYIRTAGFNYEELRFDNDKGEVLGKFLNGSQKRYNYAALRIHRTIVRDELIKELGRQDIPIHYNKKCSEIAEETEKGVTVVFADGEKATADFVVGADGIHSRVRPFIAPDCHPSFSGLMGVMGAVMADELGDTAKTLELPCMLFGGTGSFAIMPASFSADEVGYFATIEASDRGRQGWSELEENKDELYGMLRDRFLGDKSKWPQLVKGLCEKTPKETLTSWPFFSVPKLDSWSSPSRRVLVIGDSAHAIPPTVSAFQHLSYLRTADDAQGGQGAAMALEDANTLAYVFARIYASDFPSQPTRAELEPIIKSWEKHRKERIAMVTDFTTKNGALRKSSPHMYEQAAKEWLIWAMFKMTGPEGGAQAMYSYNCESVMSCFP